MPGFARIAGFAALGLALAAGAAEAEEQSVLAAAASRLAPGTWTEIATRGHEYALFKVDHHHVFQYTDDAVWHPATQQLLFIGQGHISPPLKFLAYSARTNAWRAMPIPPWAIGLRWGHGYDNNAIDARRGILYHHVSYGRSVHAYDIAAGAWRQLPDLGDVQRAHGTALAYFPEMDALVRVLRGTVHVLRDRAPSWKLAAEGLEMGPYHNIAKYSAANRAVIMGGGNDSRALHRMSADGRVRRLADAPAPIGINNSRAVTTDPVSGDLLVLSIDGALHALDVERNAWRLVARATPLRSGFVVATPVADHGVVMFVTIRPERVLLYRHDGRAGSAGRTKGGVSGSG